MWEDRIFGHEKLHDLRRYGVYAACLTDHDPWSKNECLLTNNQSLLSRVLRPASLQELREQGRAVSRDDLVACC
jgi:hypothetical protein